MELRQDADLGAEDARRGGNIPTRAATQTKKCQSHARTAAMDKKTAIGK
jgi:hypothetical protein